MMMKKQLIILGLACMSLVACKKDEEKKEEVEQTSENPDLPGTIAGTIVNMEYSFDAGSNTTYQLNQLVNFTFSSSGMLFIDKNPTAKDGDELSLSTVRKEGSEFVWDDTDNGHAYSLSLKADNSINEVNFSNLDRSAFYGQFTVLEDDTATSGNEGELTISGDVNKIGGSNFNPGLGLECDGCSKPKITWTQAREPESDKVLQVEITGGTFTLDFSAESAFFVTGVGSEIGISHDENAKSITFTNVEMREKFSQPGLITLNGTLKY